MLSSHIFRAYDIRGIVGEDFPPGSVADIGRAYGTFLIRKGTYDALVGHDARESSPEFAESFIKGLLSTGVHVHYIGHCLTQGLYYARHHYDIDGGAMITASHNPSEYNGFKLCHGTKALTSEELQSIYALIESGDFVRGEGEFHLSKNAMDEYIRAVAHRATIEKSLKVVVDTGNGMGGMFVPRLLRKLGCEVSTLYGDIDPTSPNHIADPVRISNYDALIAEVKEQKADLGIMTDGDCDRVGVVDETGQIWSGDMLLIALMRYFLPENQGANVIVEIKNTEAVVDECKRLGGNPIFSPTGNPLVDQKVKEEHAILAAENSGHIWITPDWYIFDDGVFAVCMILKILAEKQMSFSTYMNDVPEYFTTPEYRLECADEEKEDVVQQATEFFKQNCDRYIDIDGIRGYFEDGWFLVRKSNTQPQISVRAEAKSQEGLERIKQFVQEHLNSYPAITLDWNMQYQGE